MHERVVGILLAAGFSRRFGADKLLRSTPDGRPLAVLAAQSLSGFVDEVVAVARPDNAVLIEQLLAVGCRVVICPEAAAGMGMSLACGVRAAPAAAAWLIGLADMPAVRADTIATLVWRLRRGARIVAPLYHGRRGHPVGFSHHFADALTRLGGDVGAREIIAAHAAELQTVAVEDAGVLLDVDVPADLARLPCSPRC